MEKRTFTVTLELEASSEDQILNTYGLSRIIDSRFCESFEIKDPATRHRQIRLRRTKDYNGWGEGFVLESKWSDEPDDVDDCDKINFHVLGQLKNYKRNWGINVEII
mgnify:CR=1 FL=1